MEHVLSYLPCIHHWAKYEPRESQYVRYYDNPEIIATAHKILDVYWMFCSARTHMTYFQSENFGDIIPEPNMENIQYAKALFCTDALIQYAICVDLSWQVVWANYQATSLEYLLNNKYEEMATECDLGVVNSLLNCRIAYPSPNAVLAEKIKKTINEYANDVLTVQIREKYNYIKHRGKYHVDGLSENSKQLKFEIQGKSFPILSRRELDLDLLFQQLILFDIKFFRYFDSLISDLLPDDYLQNMTLNDICGFALDVKDKL